MSDVVRGQRDIATIEQSLQVREKANFDWVRPTSTKPINIPNESDFHWLQRDNDSKRRRKGEQVHEIR